MSMNIVREMWRKPATISLSIIILSIVVLSLSVNDWSFWLDEAITAEMYSVDTFSELLDQFGIYMGSEVQMPGWIAFMWAWCKLFGSSEYALRSANFLFMGLLLMYFLCILMRRELAGRERKVLWIAIVLSVINPFVLYNMNEARCNIPMFAISFINVLSLWQFMKYGKRIDFLICVCCLVVGYVFNMLYGFLYVAMAAYILYDKSRRHMHWVNLCKGNAVVVTIAVLLFVTVTVYYLITVFGENKGGQIERPGIGNIGYVMYEFAGFGGLGPNKNTLRESDDKVALLLSCLPYIIPLVLCYLALFVHSLKKYWQDKKIDGFFFAFIVGFAVFFIAAFVIQFRFWGRHLFFLYPYWLLFMACCICHFTNGSKRMVRVAVLSLFAVLIAISSYRMMFANDYKKENVKMIVDECRRLRLPGEWVYWTESKSTALYYGLNDRVHFASFPEDDSDGGMLVWFNRLRPYKEKEYSEFLELKPQLLYEDREFAVYRFASCGK